MRSGESLKMSKEDRKLSQASDIFPGLIPGKKWPLFFPRWIIWHRWEEIVGDLVAQHAYPWYFQDLDRLIIVVSDNIWMQQISFQKTHLLKKINELLPRQSRLSDLRFFLGNVDEVKKKTMLKGEVKTTIEANNENVLDPSLEEFFSLLEDLTDEGLRSTFSSLLKKAAFPQA